MNAQIVTYSAPGYYYAFAYCLAAILYVQQNPKRLRGVPLWATQLSILLAAVGFSYLTDVHVAALFLPSLLTVLVMVFIMLFSCCRISIRNAIYFSMRAFVLGEFFATLEWLIWNYLSGYTSVAHRSALNALVFVVMYAVAYAAICFMEHYFAGMNGSLELSRKSLIQVFLTSCGIYLFSNISNLNPNTPFSGTMPRDILLVQTLVDTGGVVILAMYHTQLQDAVRRVEIETLRQLMEAQYANYQIGEQSIALVQQKYHDLKHHIAFLRSELTSQEKVDYLNHMEEEIRNFEVQNDTGNRVLDTILTTKQLQCQARHIAMYCCVDGRQLDFMDEMDMTALFGNALDNAVESVSQFAEENQRLIQVNVSSKKEFLVITVGNSCAALPAFENGLPQTTKDDGRYHGFGTKSIRSIAEKYGGSAVFSAEDGWFEVKVILPVQ